MHEAPTSVERTRVDVERAPRVPVWAMLLPAVTLIGGIAIGAAVTGAGRQETPPVATSSPTPTTSPSTASVQVSVPVECLQLATEAGTALPPINDAKDAVQNLDIARIQDYITKMQVAEPRLAELAQQCRDKAGNVQLGTAPPPG
ncbi:MAG: hypothetical protein JWM93_917 [Frankiales bacterium]|nr:hypothetical protein [Frankiales bacterium]